MATPNKKPTSKVESKSTRAVAQEAEAVPAKARAPKRKPAAQADSITTARSKAVPKSDAPKPVRPRRKAEPVRDADAIDLSDAGAVQSAAPVPPGRANQPTWEQIAQRAYQIFLSRGAQHGHDEEDWQQAERDLRAHK